MAKSMRNAFIRVSSENDTENGKITYSYDDIKKIVEEWCDSKQFTYFMISHNNEEGDENFHYHIVLIFSSPTPFEQIKNKFPYGKIENCKKVVCCVQYLVHLNDFTKLTYPWSDIYTNCLDMTKYKVLTNNQGEVHLEYYLQQIDNGSIREYNLYDKIPIEIYSKYKSRLNNALHYYRERSVMDKNRNINVLFFFGSTGTGKTTYAKYLCNKKNLSYCVSSSSNDVLQDYFGQDVLILDDLRDNSFTFSDLLKVLDNFTHSSIKSRYNNKYFYGSTIIITSSVPLINWYADNNIEDKKQLYRRIQEQYYFTKDIIKCFSYNEYNFQYELVADIVNPINEQYKKSIKTISSIMSDEISEKDYLPL